MKFEFSRERFVRAVKAVWVICAILVVFMMLAQVVVASLLQLLAGENLAGWLQNPAVMFSATAVMYLTAIGFLALGYRMFRIKADFVKDTRIRQKFPKSGISLFFMAMGGYIVTTVLVNMLGRWLFPGLGWDQTQELGYARTDSVIELIVIGLALVVAAPVMEEVIFRGVMFSRVRRFVGAQATVLLTAAAFGLAHGQLNVGVDTFVLGLYLGWLRAETDSVWPSIALHMTKNAVAYAALFLFWPVTSTWLQ